MWQLNYDRFTELNHTSASKWNALLLPSCHIILCSVNVGAVFVYRPFLAAYWLQAWTLSDLASRKNDDSFVHTGFCSGEKIMLAVLLATVQPWQTLGQLVYCCGSFGGHQCYYKMLKWTISYLFSNSYTSEPLYDFPCKYSEWHLIQKWNMKTYLWNQQWFDKYTQDKSQWVFPVFILLCTSLWMITCAPK